MDTKVRFGQLLPALIPIPCLLPQASDNEWMNEICETRTGSLFSAAMTDGTELLSLFWFAILSFLVGESLEVGTQHTVVPTTKTMFSVGLDWEKQSPMFY